MKTEHHADPQIKKSSMQTLGVPGAQPDAFSLSLSLFLSLSLSHGLRFLTLFIFPLLMTPGPHALPLMSEERSGNTARRWDHLFSFARVQPAEPRLLGAELHAAEDV